jgi:hypothetical protein
MGTSHIMSSNAKYPKRKAAGVRHPREMMVRA